jgi:long-chain acyl-CoA synthetase
MKLIDLLKNSADKQPSPIAIKTSELELSYHQMLLEVHTLSSYLQSLGCQAGVKVAIVLGNCPEYFISFFAISAAGGTILPLSIHMTSYEILNSVQRADTSIVLTTPACSKRLVKDWRDQKKITLVSVAYQPDTSLQLETNLYGPSVIDDQNTNVALMVYTSGSTGLPKIVMLTDHQLISNMFIYRSMMGFTAHNMVYCSLLLHHIYCICAQVLTHISLGDTFILSDKPFFIKDFLTAVEAYEITITAFVPYMAMLMAEFPMSQDYNLDSLKYVTLSGAKTPKLTYLQLVERFKNIHFVNTYGMSEAGSRICLAAPLWQHFPAESVGPAIPGVDIRIMDEDGQVLPVGSTGEVQVKGPGVMKGYYKQPMLTAETLADGWLKTGDLGKLDDNGNLFLIGRKKDIIISGGDKIYPLEVEECLLAHPAVLEAAVIPRSDPKLQEVPYAFIVKKASHEVSATELLRLCRQRLSSHKVPRAICFLEVLPKLTASKIDRHKLKTMAEALT